LNKGFINLLPRRLINIFDNLSTDTLEAITEIRLRVGRPVAIRINGRVVFLEKKGLSYNATSQNINLMEDELKESFLKICENSVYSHENEIVKGYVSLPNGGRAGVCGTYIERPNGSVWLKDISSINIRIAKEVKDCAKDLYLKNISGGILICGPPHSGKTTFLRDYVRLISNGGKNVTLIDTRGEISAPSGGVPTLDIGINTDVIFGGRKSFCIENSLRAMSPDVIAFDEIGKLEELNAIADSLNCGVKVIATIHAYDKEELFLRNQKLPILETGAFGYIVFLDKSYKYEIVKVRDVIGKAYFSNIDSSNLVFIGDEDGDEAQGEGEAIRAYRKVYKRNERDYKILK